MEFFGEIYVWGVGVERNYIKVFEWFMFVVKEGLYLVFNGIGYLYVKGYGVEKKNYIKVWF